jgi:flavin reductase (DIM6/NTAB) family NADH-FMN oxidoreductase RutF
VEKLEIDKGREAIMRKNIGSVVALYPTPVTVVGAMVKGKPNWLLVAHIGIVRHDRILISCAKAHYTNQGIRENKVVSVSLVDEKLLPQVDYVGSVSGSQADKSAALSYEIGETGAPLPVEAPLTMECTVEDVYETGAFENFILKVNNTFAEERYLNEEGKVDFGKLQPILFAMPTYEYLKTGAVVGKCMKMH